MKRLLAFIFIVASIMNANAESIKLKDFSIKDVESRCLKVHGEFISHDDGSYGCSYFKGTVQCNAEQHCTGILKKERPKVSKPKQHHRHPYYHEYHWNPYQQW
jgi:hypothetical protein